MYKRYSQRLHKLTALRKKNKSVLNQSWPLREMILLPQRIIILLQFRYLDRYFDYKLGTLSISMLELTGQTRVWREFDVTQNSMLARCVAPL